MSTPAAQFSRNEALTATVTASGNLCLTASGSVISSASGTAAARGPLTWPVRISASARIARAPASAASRPTALAASWSVTGSAAPSDGN